MTLSRFKAVMRLYIEPSMRTIDNVASAIELGCTLVNGPAEADVLRPAENRISAEKDGPAFGLV